MRSFISIAVLVALAAMAFGCVSGAKTESGQQSATPTDKAADTKACVMQSAGRDVLRLTLPADASCTVKDGFLDLKSHERYVEVWLVAGARTVDEAVGRVGQEIKDEFKGFKAASTTDLTIGGTPAKRLTGSGTEADDGDPGEADVIVFKMGDHVFVACTHGESLSPAAQQWMLSLLQTAMPVAYM